MHILTKLKFIHALELKINFKINLFYFLLKINFLAYSIYAVLSRYNIFLIEILALKLPCQTSGK